MQREVLDDVPGVDSQRQPVRPGQVPGDQGDRVGGEGGIGRVSVRATGGRRAPDERAAAARSTIQAGVPSSSRGGTRSVSTRCWTMWALKR